MAGCTRSPSSSTLKPGASYLMDMQTLGLEPMSPSCGRYAGPRPAGRPTYPVDLMEKE